MTTVVRREDITRAVADAVLQTPGVAALHPGTGVEVATHFSGGKVTGVRLTGPVVEVCLVANRLPLPAVAQEAAEAAQRVLRAVGDERPVSVTVADLAPGAWERRQESRS